MPKITKESFSVTAQRERHCTGIKIFLPIGRPMSLEATFEEVTRTADGEELQRKDAGSCVINEEQIKGLSAFSEAYAQLGQLVHEVREKQEVEPIPPVE
jgi:hypothetical protein